MAAAAAPHGAPRRRPYGCAHRPRVRQIFLKKFGASGWSMRLGFGKIEDVKRQWQLRRRPTVPRGGAHRPCECVQEFGALGWSMHTGFGKIEDVKRQWRPLWRPATAGAGRRPQAPTSPRLEKIWRS